MARFPQVSDVLRGVLSRMTVLAMISSVAGCSRGAPPVPEGQGAAAKPPAAQGLLPLPEFKPCSPTTHPVLPAKWEATALLQDFLRPTLHFGKFVFDEGAGAFRFSLTGGDGIHDLLVTTDRKLYRLEGGGDLPTSCKLLTSASPYTVPTRDWLGNQATCVGEAPIAPILDRNQQWWQDPSGAGVNWIWYDPGSSLPFRSMYYTQASRTQPAPVYEYFTFDYFPTFKPVPSTNLAQILQLCQGGSQAPTAAQEFSSLSIEPLIGSKSTHPRTAAQLIAQAQTWIPGISECSSPGSLPPPWPDQVQLTAFLTAVSITPLPSPTRVFYDWTKRAQNSTLYTYPPNPQTFASPALLLGDTGYGYVVSEAGVASQCAQALPGPQVPNWKEVDGCQCLAQIAPHTVLNPSDVPTKILWCKTDLALHQVFWTWYSDTGRPVVFMQSNSSSAAGTGLNLADYYQWGPGSVAPAGTFDLPAACKGIPVQPSFPPACHSCHLPLNARGGAAATP